MKNKILLTALTLATVGVFFDWRLTVVGIFIALTGLFLDVKP